MKKLTQILILPTILFFYVGSLFAQIPSGFNYQAVVRNNDGSLMKNQAIEIKFTILNDDGNAFVKSYNRTTNNFGIINIVIGKGSSDFENINWNAGTHNLKVEIDSGAGFEDLGTTNILAVPFSNLAMNVINNNDADSDPTNEFQSLSFNSGTNELTISGGNTITIPSGGTDGDADPTNEIQTLTKSGNTISLSDGGGNVIDEINDADNNPENELQTLSINNYQLSISNGNTILLPVIRTISDFDDDTQIQVEKTPDDDKIRFKLIGVEHFVMNKGRFEVKNTGNSIFLGAGAGKNDDLSDNRNTFIGDSTGYKNSSGELNTIIGSNAFYNNTLGKGNTALGVSSMFHNIEGEFNIALGTGTLYNNIWGRNNSAIGTATMFLNNIGSNNVANGYNALFSNISGNSNVAIGVKSLFRNTDRSNLVAIGDSALLNNGIGSAMSFHAINNTAVGSKTLFSNTIGDNNTALGFQALYSNTVGFCNTAIGGESLHNNIGNRNSAIGCYTLKSNISGDRNTANGYSALKSNEGGNNNTAIGCYALKSNISGFSNVAIGIFSLFENTNKSNLVAIGDSALYNNGNWNGVGPITWSTKNTAVGSKSLLHNTKGESNTANGYQTLYSNNLGYSNTAFGSESLFSNTIGDNNTANGYKSLYSNASGNQNTAFGAYSGYLNKGSGNIFLGFKAGHGELGDNTLYIDNSSSKYPLIYGDFSTDKLGINGFLGIETNNPKTELHIHDGLIDADNNVTIRLQSYGANKDGIIEFYEGGAGAMSMHYSGTTNSLSFIDLARNPQVKIMTFERNGDIGIGIENPTHLLDVGNSGAYCDGGAWVDGSSREYKTKIKNLKINEALLAFDKLQPVRFRYKDDPEEENLGFIAEDVPDLVATKDRKGVSPMDFVAILTKVMQKQQDDIKTLQKALQIQEQEYLKLTNRLDKIESQILIK